MCIGIIYIGLIELSRTHKRTVTEQIDRVQISVRRVRL